MRYQHAAADRDKVIAAALSELAAGTGTPISSAGASGSGQASPGHDEVAAAHAAADQALLAQHRERPLGGALGNSVLLCECLHRGDARRDVPRGDLAAQDGR